MSLMNEATRVIESEPGVVMHNADVWLDGIFVGYQDALVSPLSHSLGYATTVYEGIRSYGGLLFRFDEHLDRLHSSASIFSHEIVFGDDVLKSVCETLLARNGLSDGYVKIQVFFDDGDVSFKGIGCQSRILISTSPKPAQKAMPWELAVAPWRRPGPRCHPYQAKTSSTYALSYLCHRARPQWADDVLFLTEDDVVCEASGANIGFVKGMSIVMPGTECSLAGVTRRLIIESLAPRLGIATKVRNVHLNELDNFDGAFVCGTAVEVIPVSRIDEVTYTAFDVQKRLAAALIEMACGKVGA